MGDWGKAPRSCFFILRFTLPVYDARGNGDGVTVNTITGDHENRVTDYTAIVLDGTPNTPGPKTLKIRSGCEGGGKGILVQDNLSATLATHNDQTVFVPVPAAAFGICSLSSNSMKSSHPNSGIYEADTAGTLDCNAANPSCNQGGLCVVSIQGSMIGRKPENGPQGSGFCENVSHTLTQTDRHGVAYSVTSDCRALGCEEKSTTLQACDCKPKPSSSRPRYIVRRLLPQECALLQGAPRDWCANLETLQPTEDDIAFWSEVFETHRKIAGTSSKPKSRKQIIKWLQNPHSDSAEYMAWGNSIAVPCAVFILGGIVWIENQPGDPA